MLDKDEFSVVRNELISQMEINHIGYGYSLQRVSAYVLIILIFSNCTVSLRLLLHSYSMLHNKHNKVFPWPLVSVYFYFVNRYEQFFAHFCSLYMNVIML